MTRYNKYSEHYSQDALNALEKLAIIAKEYGHVPDFSEALHLYEIGFLPHPNDFAFWCNSYQKAAEEVQNVIKREHGLDFSIGNQPKDDATVVTPIGKDDDNNDDFWQDPKRMTPSQ